MSEVTITYIGGPTALIEFGGLRLLTDPAFDPAGGDYTTGPVTLHKLEGPAHPAASLGRVDAVLLSHDHHFDNLDHAGRDLLATAGGVLTTQDGEERLGGNAVGIAPWEVFDLSGPNGRILRIIATPARHGPRGFEPISGDVVGFLLTLGDRTIYVSGDTVWYDGVADIASRYDVDVAILFTGAARPRGAFHVTMDNNDAVEAAHAFGEAQIVAVHNEGWGHFSETQGDLAQLFEVLGLKPRLRLVERGVPLSLELA